MNNTLPMAHPQSGPQTVHGRHDHEEQTRYNTRSNTRPAPQKCESMKSGKRGPSRGLAPKDLQGTVLARPGRLEVRHHEAAERAEEVEQPSDLARVAREAVVHVCICARVMMRGAEVQLRM